MRVRGSVLVERGPGGLLHLGAVSGPVGLDLGRKRGGVRTECAVQLLAEDISVPEVPVRLSDEVDHDVEQPDGRSGPPGTYPAASIGNASIVASACSHARWYAVMMLVRDSLSVIHR